MITQTLLYCFMFISPFPPSFPFARFMGSSLNIQFGYGDADENSVPNSQTKERPKNFVLIDKSITGISLPMGKAVYYLAYNNCGNVVKTDGKVLNAKTKK